MQDTTKANEIILSLLLIEIFLKNSLVAYAAHIIIEKSKKINILSADA